MVTKELILQEIESMSEISLARVLGFVRSLKETDANCNSQTSDSVIVMSSDGEVNVPLETFLNENVSFGIDLQQDVTLNPIAQVRQELAAALKNSGYDSKDAIVALVQDVKQEMLVERKKR